VPLKPRQCFLVFDDPLLMVNNGNLWIDNLYLMAAKRSTIPRDMITIGAPVPTAAAPDVKAGQVYLTGVTFQPGSGATTAIIADVSNVPLVLHGVPPGAAPVCYDQTRLT